VNEHDGGYRGVASVEEGELGEKLKKAVCLGEKTSRDLLRDKAHCLTKNLSFSAFEKLFPSVLFLCAQ